MNSRTVPGPLRAVQADETATVVRLHAVTDGRTRARHSLSLHTVLGPGRRAPRPGLPAESVRIVQLCRQRRRPLAELAGMAGLHVAAVRVLASDLIDAGVLTVPVPDVPSGQGPDVQMLHAVAAALRLKFPDAAAKAG
ncbi:DUF742 domain-containing protein [Streptomyces sp. Root1310]|uniref:DUF742 domain-containing protein n=1 Tax=Streptomyces sp. Root1310 TaxID=1736452 RepID=UPI000AA9EF84|nr:DUF742 domain-containing protein [Streptomyces sp. Root1310]